jgi:Zn-dependent protease
MLFTLHELIDIIIMTAGIGFIFSSMFKKHSHYQNDPVAYYKNIQFGFDWQAFKFSMMVAAPGVILHELMHKFVALGFGLNAVFHAAYKWLALGIGLKLLNFPFVFFVPGYVSITGMSTPFQFFLTAFAGPLANGLFWLVPTLLVKYNKVPKKYLALAILTAKINGILFIFNMLPIPGFDGSKVFAGLFGLF